MDKEGEEVSKSRTQRGNFGTLEQTQARLRVEHQKDSHFLQLQRYFFRLGTDRLDPSGLISLCFYE